MTGRRYPLQPLIDASGLSSGEARLQAKASGGSWTRAERDGLTEATADRWAVRLGIHPYEVWPEMVEHDLERQTVECLADDCSARFIPAKNQRFCAPRCARRVKQRRYRSAHPEQQERDRERARRYHSETATYQRMRRARRLQQREAA